MTASELPSQSKRLWLLGGLAPLAFAAPLQGQAQAQVIWEPVTEEQADQLQILVPAVDGGATNVPTSPFESNATAQPAAPQPIVWEVVPDPEASDSPTTNPSRSTEVVWEPLPSTPSVAADGSHNGPATAIVWEVLLNTIAPLAPENTDTFAGIEDVQSSGNSTVSSSEEPPAEVIAQEEAMPPRVIPGPPPPPPLQALNRSIAFGDGLVGPDIGWRVPNGLRWSRRWFGDATVQAINRRQKGDDNFFDFGQGDGEGIVHANLLQTENWSVGLNTSFRSLQSNPNIAGGSTGITDGISTGFRVARAIGDTGGIAFGAEQLIQWDDNTDTGRNIYLMATKGWWLGNQGKDYPLVIANGGLGTGAFQYDNPLRFACINNVQNRPEPNFQRDTDLCWGPIGTAALVFNEYFGIFTEYNGTATTLSASLNLTGGIPIRLTWGFSFAGSQELREDFDQYRWTFGASIGF